MTDVTLTLDPGGSNEQVFVGQGNIEVDPELTFSPVVSVNDSQIVAAATTIADEGTIGGSPLAAATLNIGAGTRVYELRFDKWQGETGNSWGGISGEISGDPTPTEYLQYLEDALLDQSPDSLTPAQLEVGIFSSSGIRSPLTVAPQQYTPGIDYQERAGAQRVRLALIECLDLSGTIDEAADTMSDALQAFSFTPSGATSPKFPIPTDTLSQQTREQGQEVQRNAVDDPAGSASTPSGDVQRSGQEPADFTFDAVWRGANAQSLAESLKNNVIQDPDVQAIDVTAKQGSSEYAGTFSLAETGLVEPLDPRTDNLWRFRLGLVDG